MGTPQKGVEIIKNRSGGPGRDIAYELTKMSETCILTFVIPLCANILLSLDFAALHHAITFPNVFLAHIISRYRKYYCPTSGMSPGRDIVQEKYLPRRSEYERSLIKLQ